MAKNITERIEECAFTFSKGQKRIASAIINNYEKTAYMTAAKLGIFCEVSESTVVRFATQIGYAGYPEMQSAVKELLRTKLTSSQRIAVTNEHLTDGDLLSIVLNADIEKIKHTLENTNRAVFAEAVNTLLLGLDALKHVVDDNIHNLTNGQVGLILGNNVGIVETQVEIGSQQ